MDGLKVYKDKKIGKMRVVIIDGIRYFVVKDIVHILLYSSVRNALRVYVQGKDNVVTKCYNGLIVVNEIGLMYLIDGSRMHKAEELKRWLYEDIVSSEY